MEPNQNGNNWQVFHDWYDAASHHVDINEISRKLDELEPLRKTGLYEPFFDVLDKMQQAMDYLQQEKEHGQHPNAWSYTLGRP